MFCQGDIYKQFAYSGEYLIHWGPSTEVERRGVQGAELPSTTRVRTKSRDNYFTPTHLYGRTSSTGHTRPKGPRTQVDQVLVDTFQVSSGDPSLPHCRTGYQLFQLPYSPCLYSERNLTPPRETSRVLFESKTRLTHRNLFNGFQRPGRRRVTM